ncbi:hypothetical protein BER93_08295 [Xanthomonas fragariae]|nr:hypothetical protein BER92_08270 [Xanthomonas fragariae]AOD18125.1 hypothetical protein BER93_08295 [Xanthomonas fragariae]ENZ96335.1 hypothetical protein O1K_04836 [Xanthomonas fragariae LMG 25863]
MEWSARRPYARVVTGGPLKISWALDTEQQFGATGAEFGIVAIGADRAVEGSHIVVGPIAAVGLDQAIQRDLRAADHINGGFSLGGGRGQCQQHGGAEQGRRKFQVCLAA